MRDKKLEKNLGGALRFIIENFGKSSLLDTTHIIKMTMELRPNLSEEIEYLKQGLDLGIAHIFLSRENTNNTNRRISIKRAKYIMKQNGIPKKTRKLIIESLTYGLKWPKIKRKKISAYIKEIPIGIKEVGSFLVEDISTSIREIKPKPKDESLTCEAKNNSKTNPYFKWIFIGIICITIFMFFNRKPVDVTDIAFNTKYKKEDSTYVFKKGDFIVMNLELEGKRQKQVVDKKNLSYTSANSKVCKVSNDFSKCRITGVGAGDTKINVYYNNKLIKKVHVLFKN